jgi:glycosyltransferase involved in cell wall biosynthesis
LSISSLQGKVVLLIPTYNSELTILETLKSILGQGEALNVLQCVLIADGGSSDRTLEVAKECWNCSVPIRFKVTRPGRGEAQDVNDAALSLSNEAEWFMLMHSDNVAYPNWIETILGVVAAADERVASVCSSYDSWVPGIRLSPGENLPGISVETIRGNRASVKGTLFQGCWWHHSTAAIRVTALREMGGYLPEFRHHLDWDLLLRFLGAGWNILYVRKSLMKYREHGSSLSNRNMLEHMDVREQLIIARKFQFALSLIDLIRFHRLRAITLLRRGVSAIYRLQGRRFLFAVKLLAYLPISCTLCIIDRIFGRVHPQIAVLQPK